MNNKESLLALEQQEGSAGAAALAVGATPQMWANWKNRATPRYAGVLARIAMHPRCKKPLKAILAMTEKAK